MVNPKRALVIAAVIMPTLSLGAELASPVPVSSDRSRSQKECDRRFRENNCTQFFKDNPNVAEFAVNCDNPVNPVEELKHCGSGGLNATEDLWRLISSVYAALTGISENIRTARLERDERLNRVWGECVKSLECKIAAYTSARGQDPNDSTRDFLNRLNDVSKFENFLFHASSAKLSDKRRKAVQILRSTPDSPQRDDQMNALYPGWSDRKHAAAISLWEVGRVSANYLLKVDACFSREVQTEMVCYGLASLILPGVAIKSGSKLGQITRALGTDVRKGGVVPTLTGPSKISDIHPTVRKWLDTMKPSNWAKEQLGDLGSKFSIGGKSYEIERVLGSGGEGVVALARSEEGLVVVKRFHTENGFRSYERYQKKLSDLLPAKKASDATTRTVVMQYREGIPVDELFKNSGAFGISNSELSVIKEKWGQWSQKHLNASNRFWSSRVRQAVQQEPPRIHEINAVYSPRDGRFYIIDPY